MKKKVLSLCALLMVAILQLSVVKNVSAAEAEIGDGKDEKGFISTCTGPTPTGKHLMVGRGEGFAYYGKYPSNDLRINYGCAFQCKYCYLLLVTENSPLMTGSPVWGNYATLTCNEPMGTNIAIWTNSFGYNNRKDDPYTQGFTFSNAGSLSNDELLNIRQQLEQ